MKKYQIILFDLDDTLVNTKKALKHILFDIAKSMDIKMDENKYLSFLEFDNEFWNDYEAGKIAVPNNLDNPQEIADYLRALRFQAFFKTISFEEAIIFNDKYQTTFAHYTPIDGAKELICYLNELGMKLYIATNGPEGLAAKKIEMIEVGNYIRQIYGFEKLKAAKPSEQFFENLFKELGNPPKEKVLLVGDSITTDINGGNNFGIDTCWFNPEEKSLPDGVNPTMIIKSLKKLI